MKPLLLTGGLLAGTLFLVALYLISTGRSTAPSGLSTLLGALSVPIVPHAGARGDVLGRGGSLCEARNSDAEIGNFRVRGTRALADRGIIVLYSATCPRGERSVRPIRAFGYSRVERDGWRWETTDDLARYESNDPQLPPELVTDVRTSGGSREQLVDLDSRDKRFEDYAIVFGEVLSPRVGSVEAVFDSRTVLTDSADDGVFALADPDAQAACELRVLDAEGEVLQRLDIEADMIRKGPRGNNRIGSNECPDGPTDAPPDPNDD